MALRILFGIQTTGNGHIIRGRALLNALRERGHQVHTLFSGPSTRGRWQLEEFNPYDVRTGLTFASRAGRIRHVATIWQAGLVRFLRDVHQLPWREYDLVVSDYEPISAYMALRRGLPSVGVGHLYAFVHKVPKVRSNPLIHGVMNYFAPVRTPLGMHWHSFDQPVLPPSIPTDVRNLTPEEEDFYLVYLPFEKCDVVHEFLSHCKGRRFQAYAEDYQDEHSGNVLMHPIQRQSFIEDLATCAGVITNAGFSLVSEALHLGKKVLVKPLAGQIEQESNALALEQLGLGAVMKKLDPNAVRCWEARPAIRAQDYPPVIEPLADWIGSGDWTDGSEFVKRVWAGARYDEVCFT